MKTISKISLMKDPSSVTADNDDLEIEDARLAGLIR